MAFDGAGVFTRNYSWAADAANGLKISSTRMDGEFNNFATALNLTFIRDGRAPMTGDLNLGGFRATGLHAGTVASCSLQFTGDPNTGLIAPAADTLGFVTAGVERVRVTSAGVLEVNKNTAGGLPAPLTGVVLQVANADATLTYMQTDSFGAAGGYMTRRANGTLAAKTGVLSGNTLFEMACFGYHSGAAYAATAGAVISYIANQDYTLTAQGTYMTFKTTPNGSVTPTEQMRLGADGVLTLTQGQIKFPAAQVASADANTLDDYEEGTFTPSLALGAGLAYASRSGTYTKIGRMVYFSVSITLSNKGAPTGSGVSVDGLPFTSAGTFRPAIPVVADTMLAGTGTITGFFYAANTSLILTRMPSGTLTTVTDADFTNTSIINLSGCYSV